MPKFTNSQIDFMRADIDTNFAYSGLIDSVKTRMESEGKDFYVEFIEWAKKNGKTILVCENH